MNLCLTNTLRICLSHTHSESLSNLSPSHTHTHHRAGPWELLNSNPPAPPPSYIVLESIVDLTHTHTHRHPGPLQGWLLSPVCVVLCQSAMDRKPCPIFILFMGFSTFLFGQGLGDTEKMPEDHLVPINKTKHLCTLPVGVAS